MRAFGSDNDIDVGLLPAFAFGSTTTGKRIKTATGGATNDFEIGASSLAAVGILGHVAGSRLTDSTTNLVALGHGLGFCLIRATHTCEWMCHQALPLSNPGLFVAFSPAPLTQPEVWLSYLGPCLSSGHCGSD
jgi:hypothetical protein